MTTAEPSAPRQAAPAFVVAGYDGSTPAEEAVRWAATEAALLPAELRLVTAAFYPRWITTAGDLAPGVPQPLVTAVESTRREGEALAKRFVDGSRVSSVVRDGSAAGALTEAAAGATELVVGHRGRGPWSGAVLGSVSVAVVAHAPCPVLVVRGADGPPAQDRPVVVGVDGSDHADAALAYAAAFAARHDTPLRVVAAWQEVSATGWEPAVWTTDELREWERAAQSHAEQVAASAVDAVGASHPGLPVTSRIVRGHPVQALVESSTAAGLLVVGARGLGGFRRLLLGSVSRGVVHQARCSVAVVR